MNCSTRRRSADNSCPKSAEAFLAAHRHELFPDEMFEDLFLSKRGRPSIPADTVASVMVL